MIKIHVNNIKERKNEFFNNFSSLVPRIPRDHYYLKVISTFEVFAYINFIESRDIRDVLPKFGVSDSTINKILNITTFLNDYKIFNLDENNINIVIKKNKIHYIFQNFVGGSVEQSFVDFFKEEIPICIDLNDGEKEFSLFGDSPNIFVYKHFMSNLELLNIPYGFILFFMKENMSIIKKFLEKNNQEKIEASDIKIENSIREIMKKKQKERWKENKKIHILNVQNTEVLSKIPILSYKDEKFFILHNGQYFYIKEVYELSKKNNKKIKETPMLKGEEIFVYKHNNLKYIIKVSLKFSKTISLKLLKETKFNILFNYFKAKEEDDNLFF